MTRKEFYDLVWAEPMRVIAARFEMSDVGLKKYCTKLDIPVPPRGYWAKRQAGKPTRQIALPARGLGMSDEVGIGGREAWRRWTDKELMGPLPEPPAFDESIEDVRLRAQKLIGTVRIRKISEECHPAVRRLLDKAEARRKQREVSSITAALYPALFEDPLDQRRLKLFNTLFLALARAGAKGWIEADDPGRAGVTVHDQHVHLTLSPVGTSGRGWAKDPADRGMKSDALRLAVLHHSGGAAERCAWQDEPDARLDTKLAEIAAEVLVAAELEYREGRMHHYEWRVESKARLEREAVQRKLEEERKAREMKIQREQARVDGLLAQAAALRQSADIRAYVAAVRDAVADGGEGISTEDMDRWAAWATAQADRIDPVKNGAFLKLRADDPDEMGTWTSRRRTGAPT